MPRAVIVLGAGASRGAESPPKASLQCLPPLNADFFAQLQRITVPKHLHVVEQVVSDVLELFGSNFQLTLEDYFTQLEFLIQALDITLRGKARKRSEYARYRQNLMAALSSVLEVSTGEIIKLGGCRLHAQLVQALSAHDSIISFNYDCLIDDALRRVGGGKWNPRHGYAFPLAGAKLSGLRYWEAWNHQQQRTGRSIRLLKLHGSLNWQLAEQGNSIHLKERLHQQRGTPRFSIVPPVWNKEFARSRILLNVWREAARRLRGAESAAIVGFSFARTDLYAESLFRIALKDNKKLKRLVIVNPSSEARRRARSVFDEALLQGGLVRQYDKFKDFVDSLPEALA